jgi:hypothetical protein
MVVYMADHFFYQIFELLFLYKAHEFVSTRFSSADHWLRTFMMKFVDRDVQGFLDD